MIYQANKVKSVRHADSLGKHLVRADDNEIVEVLEIRGTARPDDLTASLRSMQRATALTRGQTGLFSVAINPREHEADNMTPQQWERSIQALEEEFKELAGQPRAVVRHRKNNRSHLHVVYQLADVETGTLIDLKFDQRRCQAIGRRLEREFGHEITTEAPSRDNYNRKEQQQAKRLGQDIPQRRHTLRADFERAAGLQGLQEILAAKGYTLAKGDRAGAVLIDDKGEVFGFGRELGLKAAEVRKYIGSELDRLPTVEQVKNRRAVQKEEEPAPEEKAVFASKMKLFLDNEAVIQVPNKEPIKEPDPEPYFVTQMRLFMEEQKKQQERLMRQIANDNDMQRQKNKGLER